MKFFCVFLFVGAALCANSQQLTLQECWTLAERAYPQFKDTKTYEDIAALHSSNIKSAYYPTVNAVAQATYQSDVTHLAVSIPNISIPLPAKDQYKLMLDLSQLIWDGGATRASRNLENADLESSKMQVQTDLYAIKGRVAQIFYGIVMIQQQIEQLGELKKDLEEKLKETSVGVKYGAVLKANEQLLNAEIINIEQQIVAANADRSGLMEALSVLLAQPVESSTQLIWEEIPAVDNGRPEYELFKSQKDRIDLMNSTYTAQRMPKISAFGQVGYGKPGLNMFNSSFDSFYYVGVNLSWNVFDWNRARNNKRVLGFQQNLIDTKQEIFDQSQQVNRVQESAKITKYEKLIRSDEQLVNARKEVAKAYSVMYDKGAIDASEYVGRQTELKQAELNMEMHRVMLVFSKVNLSIINGK